MKNMLAIVLTGLAASLIVGVCGFKIVGAATFVVSCIVGAGAWEWSRDTEDSPSRIKKLWGLLMEEKISGSAILIGSVIVIGFAVAAFIVYPQEAWGTAGAVAALAIGGGISLGVMTAETKTWLHWIIFSVGIIVLVGGMGTSGYFGFVYIPPPPPAKPAEPVADMQTRVAELRAIGVPGFEKDKSGRELTIPWKYIPAGYKPNLEAGAKKQLQAAIDKAEMTKIVSVMIVVDGKEFPRAIVRLTANDASGKALNEGAPFNMDVAIALDPAKAAALAQDILNELKPLPTR